MWTDARFSHGRVLTLREATGNIIHYILEREIVGKGTGRDPELFTPAPPDE